MTDPTAHAAAAAAVTAETLKRPPSEPNDDARVAAQEFEAFFLAQVLDQMFAGISTDGRFGGGSAEGVYRDLLNQEYAKVLSRSGGIGVADAVYREILKLQEVE
jgi:Rod binding domain-containing protein